MPIRASSFRFRDLGCVPIVLVVLACTSEPEPVAFVERLGADTMAVEIFTHTDSTIQGRLLVRSPATQVAAYRADLTPDGLIGRLVTAWSTPAENPDGRPPFQTEITLDGDSATITVTGGTNPRTRRVAVPPNTFPEVGRNPYALGIFDAMARAAVSSGQERYEFGVLQASGAGVGSNAIVRHGADTVEIDFFGHPMLASVDANGVVTGRTGENTTLRLVAEQVDPGLIAFDALAADFASRDARGEGVGVPSPTDTVTAAAGGAEFTIVYSRPARRGRTIWGGLVPWNEVWRTGANAATHFATSRDLEIGDHRLPAGLYTLWSTFTPEGGSLIVNAQTGQWGTAYDASHDLFRVPLERDLLSPPAERFTISLEPEGDRAILRLDWDDARYSVPVVVR